MSRIRLLLAWLVMAALPLQGFAAATMLFCATGHLTSVSAPPSASASHSHGSKPAVVAHDHAAHGHATVDQATSVTGFDGGAHANQENQAHSCSICASCCHVIAIASLQPDVRTAAPPGAVPPAPLVRVAMRTSSVPDKPPRA